MCACFIHDSVFPSLFEWNRNSNLQMISELIFSFRLLQVLPTLEMTHVASLVSLSFKGKPCGKEEKKCLLLLALKK